MPVPTSGLTITVLGNCQRPPLDLYCKKGTFQDMKKILIIVPDGGMLFEAAGIADILMQANRLHPDGLAQPRYRIIIATTQPHLAQAGLLDGRRATTHWRLLETLKTRYPAVNVEGGPLYVQDGPVWTSGGVSSGFDLTLALVEDDYGFTLARNVAQDMVMYLRRPGGQLQFSRYNLEQSGATGPVSELQSWILQNLTADLCVERLAERVAMSPRNFTRVFTRDVGVPPARYVTEARLAAARQLLEQTPYPLEVIAEKSGFGTSINLRRVFEKQLHLTPGEYRQRFHCRRMA